MDFWKYFKQEAPITKPQLFRIRGGKKRRKKKKKASLELFMAFFTEIGQDPSQDIFPALKSISNGKKQSFVGAFPYR